MKSFLRIIFLFSVFFSFQNIYPQIPGYTLKIANGVYAPDLKSVTFDIILTHTNSAQFEYSGSQYFFKIPQSFGTLGVGSGAASGFQYDSAGGTHVSDIPSNFIPRNPSVAAVDVNGIPFYELRLISNGLPGAGNGLIIPPNVPLLIIRMKIKSGSPLNSANANLEIRDSCSDNPASAARTKLGAYIGTTHTEITSCANHFVDHSFFPLSQISCNLKLAIEGLYNFDTDKLNKKDSVTAFLRNVNSPYQILDTQSSLIDSVTLTGNFSFINSTRGRYFIVVKHQNSMETWSRPGGENLVSGNNNFDFTASASQSYGNNMVLKGSRYCIFSGDINRDNIIDLADLSLVDNDVINYAGAFSITNLNGDNIVDIDDLAIVDRNSRDLITVQKPGMILSSGKKNVSFKKGVRR